MNAHGEQTVCSAVQRVGDGAVWCMDGCISDQSCSCMSAAGWRTSSPTAPVQADGQWQPNPTRDALLCWPAAGARVAGGRFSGRFSGRPRPEGWWAGGQAGFRRQAWANCPRLGRVSRSNNAPHGELEHWNTLLSVLFPAGPPSPHNVHETSMSARRRRPLARAPCTAPSGCGLLQLQHGPALE